MRRRVAEVRQYIRPAKRHVWDEWTAANFGLCPKQTHSVTAKEGRRLQKSLHENGLRPVGESAFARGPEGACDDAGAQTVVGSVVLRAWRGGLEAHRNSPSVKRAQRIGGLSHGACRSKVCLNFQGPLPFRKTAGQEAVGISPVPGSKPRNAAPLIRRLGGPFVVVELSLHTRQSPACPAFVPSQRAISPPAAHRPAALSKSSLTAVMTRTC